MSEEEELYALSKSLDAFCMQLTNTLGPYELRAAGKDNRISFALFLTDGSGTAHYLSPVRRDDVAVTLDDWLLRTVLTQDVSRRPLNSSLSRMRERKVEEACGSLGKRLFAASHWQVALFFFDVTDRAGGALAWFLSHPALRDGIQAFVTSVLGALPRVQGVAYAEPVRHARGCTGDACAPSCEVLRARESSKLESGS